LVVGEQPAFGDADQGVVRLVILALREERLVRRDQGDAVCVGKLDERRLGMALDFVAVALQLDIEAVAEEPPQRMEPRGGKLALPRRDGAVERTRGAARERQEAVRLAVERGEIEMRPLTGGRSQIGPRGEAQTAQIYLVAG